jgi:hypothetical protein
MWRVRAGENGEHEDFAIKRSVASIVYSSVPDLHRYSSREELRADLSRIYPDDPPRALSKHAQQLWDFFRNIHTDDVVAMPLKKDPELILFGIVHGPYEYRTNADPGTEHSRGVTWLPGIPRSDIDDDLLRSIGAPGTVARIKPNEPDDAERRIRELISAQATTRAIARLAADEQVGPSKERGGMEEPRRRPISELLPKKATNGVVSADPEARRQKQDRRNNAHKALVLSLKRKAQAAQIKCDETEYADALADGCIFEMKSLEHDEIAQIRAAVGQLYHYLFLHRAFLGYEDAHLCAVFDKPIDAELCTFINTRARIGVLWPKGSGFDGTDDMRERFPWIFR